MARGLSDLQKTILRLAAESDSGSIPYAKILSEYYGWHILNRKDFLYGYHNFSMQAIGEKRYRAARVSVSRAAARLEKRGLVYYVVRDFMGKKVSYPTVGVGITDAGWAVAEKLIEDRLLDAGWSEDELDLRRRLLAGETVVYSRRISGRKSETPHARFHKWAEAEGRAVYIGDRDPYQRRWPRSDWYNRHHRKNMTDEERREAVGLYYEDLLNNPDLLARVPELRGKALGCWCAPDACHGDVLKALADALAAPATAA